MQKISHRTGLFNTLFIAFLIVACNNNDNNATDNAKELPVEQTPPTESRLPEPDLLQRLSYQKNIIDTMFYTGRYIGEPYGLLKDGHVIPMTDDLVEESGSFSKTYLVIKDSTGNIVRIQESPYSESGDWSLSVAHYFDKNNKTFVVEKSFGLISSPCGNGSASETKTAFYDGQMKVIQNTHEIRGEGNKIVGDSCISLFYNDYLVAPNTAACLKQFGLDTVRLAEVVR